MEITFEKVNNEYIAEFEITTDSNLHIEKKCASSTKLYQRTNGGGWDLVDETKNMQGAVDDFDLSALVYPKFIKVVCNAEPLYAEVTTSGEVTEIKSQSKEIEVTSNGTTEVTPDAGFAYLNSVKVKTNVAQSGEGGGSNYIYYDQKKTILNVRSAWEDAILLKVEVMELKLIGSPLYCYKMFESAPEGFDLESSITAVCFDLNLRIDNTEFSGTIEEKYADYIKHLRDEISITEEEFYNLNA